jgi:antirestriction protein ArdC
MKTDELYQKITDQVIAQLENDPGTWEKPWFDVGGWMFPKSKSSGKPYSGVNVLILASTGAERGYTSDEWGTFNAWKDDDQGSCVRKGEKGTHIFLLKPGTPPSKAKLARDPDAKPFTMMRAFAVFNRDQVDGLPPLPPPKTLALHERISEAEKYFEAIGAHFREDGDRAYYSVGTDSIVVPKIGQFANPEAYYSTVAHEHVHWTGSKDRLNRTFGHWFKNHPPDEAYAAEELVAELGAAYWCVQMGITPAPRPDHAQYLSHWLKVLKADCKAIVTAASAASKALEHLNTAAAWQPDREMEMA